jgi:hypothetical protein
MNTVYIVFPRKRSVGVKVGIHFVCESVRLVYLFQCLIQYTICIVSILFVYLHYEYQQKRDVFS